MQIAEQIMYKHGHICKIMSLRCSSYSANDRFPRNPLTNLPTENPCEMKNHVWAVVSPGTSHGAELAPPPGFVHRPSLHGLGTVIGWLVGCLGPRKNDAHHLWSPMECQTCFLVLFLPNSENVNVKTCQNSITDTIHSKSTCPKVS